VIANPEPQNSTLDIDTEGAMVKAHPAGPEATNALELKRRMAGVLFQEAELLIRQAL
jgi:hypothetical protein